MIHLPVIVDVAIVLMIVVIFSDVILCRIQRKHRRKDYFELLAELNLLEKKISDRLINIEKDVIENKLRLDALKKLEGLIK